MLAHLNRGLCYFNMGSPEMALPDWDTVRNHEPNTQNLAKYLGIAGKYFYSKGMNYEKNNQNDSAVHAFKLCADATPEAPEPWFQLALACKMTGRPTEAKSAILHALQIAPNNREAKQLLGDIENTSRGQGGK
jgi:tetratricopeptide (TPR) repeat protein